MSTALDRLEELSRLPERVTKIGDVDLVGREWALLERRIAAIDMRKDVVAAAAVMAAAQVERGEIREKLKGLLERYKPQIESFAKKQIWTSRPGWACRTWESGTVKVAFTACNSTTIDVIDPKTGLPFLVKHCPEAIEYEPKVRKAKFTKAFLEKVSAMSKTALVRAGLSVTKPHDNISVTLRS